ncbi:hypothetical protein EYZ11_000785 [Aspergillus tanneri]|uniref:F-box domain-containing protein n=1 Tax=Aspergillus tanneri TaxID=1220188 RepID=A0A4S3JWB2_9EURO|nr:uncharacterized protein ATNIH1004_004905 [Aspergillus tanneri]KAA8649015.1 hypothetical protein ATNIH1004_004905 [Aspergillus tanneri]THC99735.1 hypothetical protein EYZ11_000785 [Aspergillus tanneri]
MQTLLEIPAELRLLIYQELDDIDDALLLTRICKQLNIIFDEHHPTSQANFKGKPASSQVPRRADWSYIPDLDPSKSTNPRRSLPGHEQVFSCEERKSSLELEREYIGPQAGDTWGNGEELIIWEMVTNDR